MRVVRSFVEEDIDVTSKDKIIMPMFLRRETPEFSDEERGTDVYFMRESGWFRGVDEMIDETQES
jgi:hypothetical protein